MQTFQNPNFRLLFAFKNVPRGIWLSSSIEFWIQGSSLTFQFSRNFFPRGCSLAPRNGLQVCCPTLLLFPGLGLAAAIHALVAKYTSPLPKFAQSFILSSLSYNYNILQCLPMTSLNPSSGQPAFCLTPDGCDKEIPRFLKVSKLMEYINKD